MYLRRLFRSSRPGFTLLELILVLGMLAIIAFIVIVAINPTNQIEESNNSKRTIEAREIENAVLQYYIDGNSFPGIPSTKGSARDICRGTLTGSSCTGAGTGMDLSSLVPNYLVDIPVDPLDTTNRITGYRIYTLNSFIKVCSSRLEATCGP